MFEFNITLTDLDYYEYNKYVSFHMPSGKKMHLRYRILIVVMCLLGGTSLLLRNGFNTTGVIKALLVAVVPCAIFQALWKPLSALSIKAGIKRMKNSGKLPYTADSKLSFSEDRILETTETSKTEVNYSAVERIHMIPGKCIYVFTDTARAYIIPADVFASTEQYDAFVKFLEDRTGVQALISGK